MFEWQTEKVRFMHDASEYGNYYEQLAHWVVPHIHPGDRICDAGCGLGYLSLALAPHVGHITAIDRSEAALSVLRENCAARSIGNVEIRCGDIFTLPPHAPYDDMVFCFFGSMEDIAAIVKARCRGAVYIFKKNYSTHRFSVGSHPVGDDSYSVALRWLEERGVPFTSEERELEMGQPFRTREDARRFFELYSRDGDKAVITNDFLRSRLVETGRADFPLYLPQNRPVGCIRLAGDDLAQTV